MPNRNNHRRPGGANFNSFNSYGESEFTQTGFQQSHNNQMGYECYDPRFQGPTNYGWHQLPPNHQRSGYSGSQWNYSHDFNHTRLPHPSNYSRSNYQQNFENPSHYGPRQENTNPNFKMRNNQFTPTQNNSYSNQFRPFNNRNIGEFKQSKAQYGGVSQNDTQEHLPCQDEKMALSTTDQPITTVPSYIAANNWMQAGVADNDDVTEASSSRPVKRGKVDKQVKGLMKGLNQPVEADKAQRMMAMMGWQGGALGCNRDGLTEPLMPNLLHQKGAGLGHQHADPLPPKTKKPAKSHKNIKNIQEKLNREENSVRSVKKKKRQWNMTTEHELSDIGMVRRRPKLQNLRRQLPADLQTAILNKILCFVSDPKQEKVAFDKTLKKQQRAYIHFLAEAMGETDGVLYNGCLDSPQQAKIIERICECNSYMLTTESEGDGDNRRIFLYKEAPNNMYLITKDDLGDHSDYDETDDEIDDEDIEKDKVIALDDDDNELDKKKLGNDQISIANDENITENEVKVKIDRNPEIDNIKLDPNTVDRDNDDKIYSIDTDEVKCGQIIGESEHKAKVNPNDEIKESIADSLQEHEIENKLITKKEEQIKIEDKPILKREEEIRILLLKYFKEFVEDTKYTEMRFLGHFDDIEEKAIVNFVTDIEKCNEDVNYCKNLVTEDWLEPIFLDTTYKLMTMANTDGYSDNIIEKILRNDYEETESIY